MPWVEDGVGHFAYVDLNSDLTFAWDGMTPDVQVYRGGEVIDTFPLRYHYQPRSAARWLEYFSVSCVLYMKGAANDGSNGR
jgi:hypothetical protein